MSAFQNLLSDTTPQRNAFIAIPLIQEVLKSGAPRALYIDFLGQAYHHVKNTAPLLALAAARCRAEDNIYQTALFEYIEEERGHEAWILEDIEALGGDAASVRHSAPRLPCKVMVGHAYYVVERISPYALLGMIHVLEGMAVALAGSAVAALRSSVGPSGEGGFKYLTTHGDLDVEHSALFADLVERLGARHLPVIVESTADFYKLYGDIFRDIDLNRRNAQQPTTSPLYADSL
jgi:pyrroloquinoline quinone (PQQ) biosynthesis protein C